MAPTRYQTGSQRGSVSLSGSRAEGTGQADGRAAKVLGVGMGSSSVLLGQVQVAGRQVDMDPGTVALHR